MNNDRYLALIGYEWRLKTPLELVQARRHQEYLDALEAGERPVDDDEIPF
tara:strand:+ start:610 stop:759 length:150 start_codon:yes stop_codon:yes gene_type:complete